MNFVQKTLFLFSIFFLCSILFLTALYVPFNEYSSEMKTIQIPIGSNATHIRNILEENLIIRKNALIFNIYVRLFDLGNKLRYGEYTLSSSMNLIDILGKLIKGEVIEYKITIPEGYNYVQIADLLHEKDILNKEQFIKLAVNGDRSWEGFLFPDTYELPKNYGSIKMLETFLTNFNRIIEKHEIRKTAVEMNFTLNEIITLASIIEKEAKNIEDKKLVSAVFHNRLKKEMKLQSCATIYYILGHNTKKLDDYDLKIESPFNTYINKGLPPNPICNPGLDSIKAALNPADEDFLYFVLGEDGNHIFSKDYNEHLKNKNKR